MRPRRAHTAPSRRAVILVLTLWIVLILGILAQSLAFDMRIEMLLTRLHRDRFLAEQIARIGVGRAMVDLRNDRLLEGGADTDEVFLYDALGDLWCPQLDPIVVKLDTPKARLERYGMMVVDEESKLPLNAMDPGWIDAMRYLLMTLDVDEDHARVIAQAIWDWKDPDSVPIGGEAETERAAFAEILRDVEGLAPDEVDPQSLRPLNMSFSTVDELLLVPGVSPELFYGYDPEETDDPPFFPARNMGRPGERRPALRDLLTVRTAEINVNTAQYEVLWALCATALQEFDAGESLAEAIIETRSAGFGDDLDNERALRSVDELGLIAGVTAPLIERMKQVSRLSVRSRHFTIYSLGEAGKATVRREFDTENERRPPSRARIIVDCYRFSLSYGAERFEQGRRPPGWQTKIPGAGRERQAMAQWNIPVVYVKRWVTY